MSKIATFLTVLGTVLVCSLPAALAQAQSLRTFVSAAGSDSNNCTDVSTPCRHFFQAYAATSPGGEIDVLDPANYGGLIITQAISIEGFGWATAAAGSGAAVITINAGPSDKVSIRGVVLNGFGFANNTGIQFNTGDSLNVQDCEIRNFGSNGINFTSNAFTHLSVSNTLVLNNASAGINLAPVASVIIASIDRVTVISNGYGIFSNNAAGGLEAAITNSVISSNLNGGIKVTASSPNGAVISIKDSTLTHHGLNGGAAISISGGIFVLLSHSLIAHNANGIVISGSGTNIVYSAGDNDMFDNNTPISGGSLTPNPKQ